MKQLLTFIIIGILSWQCQSPKNQGTSEKDADIPGIVTEKDWGELAGKPVLLYTLENENGMNIQITNFGGIIVSVNVPDKNGEMDDVVLGFGTFEEYLNKNRPYFGALIGRYANRIYEGKFTIDDTEYQLEVNSPPNHIHGGSSGFGTVVWDSKPIETMAGPGVELTYHSPDSAGGFPGNLNVVVKYTLTRDNEIMIEYEATTDKPTILNLTNHSYFNLAGHDSGTILDQQIKINASEITPVDENLIPTGELMEVENSPFDFREFKTIGDYIDQEHPQLAFAGGFDHNFIIRGNRGSLRTAAQVKEPTTGRILTVYTTEPGLQFYAGNFLNGTEGKNGAVYDYRGGFCLEAQHYPNSPNIENFPSVVLRPDEVYKQTTIYRFSVE
ncbi:MAG: aldose epimerase family protein [Cyclobacteriaceae bacterium]